MAAGIGVLQPPHSSNPTHAGRCAQLEGKGRHLSYTAISTDVCLSVRTILSLSRFTCSVVCWPTMGWMGSTSLLLMAAAVALLGDGGRGYGREGGMDGGFGLDELWNGAPGWITVVPGCLFYKIWSYCHGNQIFKVMALSSVGEDRFQD